MDVYVVEDGFKVCCPQKQNKKILKNLSVGGQVEVPPLKNVFLC